MSSPRRPTSSRSSSSSRAAAALETFADPAARAADAVEDVAHPVAGPGRTLRFPVEFSTGRATVRRPPPTVGQHTDEILREAGYGGEAIRGLRDEGAV